MRPARVGLVLLGLLLAVALGACTGLPTDSPVQAQGSIAPEPDQVVNVRPPGPARDASARDIVRGFLRANAYSTDDYAVAREFLTASASSGWDPERQLSINTGERDFVDAMTDTGTVSVTARETALLDSQGRLTDEAVPQSRTGSFAVRKVDGQWRISTLPKGFGAWISESDFDIGYTAQRVFYAVPATKTLVADVRWFPLSGLTTALARAVLTPPPVYLSPVATAQMPRGTALRVDAVPVDSGTGVATVDLTSSALAANPTQRTALWAQMLATLSLTRGVRSVVITVDGSARLETPDLPQHPQTPQDLGYTVVQVNRSDLIGRSGTTLRWFDQVTSGRPVSVGDSDLPSLPQVAANWSDLAASADGRQLAGVSAAKDRLARWVNGRLVTLPVFGTQLTAPSFTGRSQHEIWVAGSALSTAAPGSGTTTVWFVPATGSPETAQPQPVEANWLAATTVLAMAASADGNRVAMVLATTAGGGQVVVSAIQRDSSGRPTGLTRPMVMGRGLTDVRAVTWLDDITLGVLARDGTDNDSEHAVQIPLGGMMEDLGQNPDQALTAIRGVGDSPSDVYLVTAAHRVLIHEGATWTPVTGLTDLVVPGS